MGLAKELRNRRTITAKEVSVQGWADSAGEPFVLYCKPITCYDVNELQKKHKNFLESPSIASMVDMIILKAVDESGDKLFAKSEDKIDLMGEETGIISDIANQMFSTIVDAEEAEKN